jgi:restriction system protein
MGWRVAPRCCERIGQTGDGGIDGIIWKIGLASTQSSFRLNAGKDRSGGQKSKSSLVLCRQRARKGVFITTSFYTSDAIDYASRIDTKVVLIDGKHLSALMIDFDVGVAAAASYVVKRIDSDYFEEN